MLRSRGKPLSLVEVVDSPNWADPLNVILLLSCCAMTAEMLLFISSELTTFHEIIRCEQSTQTESSTRTFGEGGGTNQGRQVHYQLVSQATP